MGGPRWFAIALVALIVGGLAAWGIVEATSSDGGDGTRLVDTAQEERVQQRIERLERMLIAIDRADEQPTARQQARRAAARQAARQKQRALRRENVRRAKARARAARARATRHAQKAAAGKAAGGGGSCDPNYEGACLDPNASDYDCSDGSGDGPEYTGTVTVVGEDHYDLDSNNDGIGCEEG